MVRLSALVSRLTNRIYDPGLFIRLKNGLGMPCTDTSEHGPMNTWCVARPIDVSEMIQTVLPGLLVKQTGQTDSCDEARGSLIYN